MKRFFQELGFPQEEYIIHCDSQSAMDLSKNSMYHSHTKHIDIHYHWLREAIEGRELKLLKINTNNNPTDMLTKVVTQEKHKLCAEIVGMRIVGRRLEGEICCVLASKASKATVATFVDKMRPRVAKSFNPTMNTVNEGNYNGGCQDYK